MSEKSVFQANKPEAHGERYSSERSSEWGWGDGQGANEETEANNPNGGK